jgi:hypothetical protein
MSHTPEHPPTPPITLGTFWGGGAAEECQRLQEEIADLTHRLDLARAQEETWKRFARLLHTGIENMDRCPLCQLSLSRQSQNPETDGSRDRKPPGFSWPRNEWNTSSGSSLSASTPAADQE